MELKKLQEENKKNKDEEIQEALKDFPTFTECTTKLMGVIDGKNIYVNLNKVIKNAADLNEFYNNFGVYPEFKRGQKTPHKILKSLKDDYKSNSLSPVEIAVCEKLPYWDWLEDANKWISETKKAKSSIANRCFVDYSFEVLATDEKREKQVRGIKEEEFEMVKKNWEHLCSIYYSYGNNKRVFDYCYQKLSHFHDEIFDKMDSSFEKLVLLKTSSFCEYEKYKLYMKAGYTNYKNPGFDSQMLSDFNTIEQEIIEKYAKQTMVDLEIKIKDDYEKLKTLLLDDDYLEKIYYDLDCILKKELIKNPLGEISKLHCEFLLRKKEELKQKIITEIEKEKKLSDSDKLLLDKIPYYEWKENTMVTAKKIKVEMQKMREDQNAQNFKKLQLLVLIKEELDFSEPKTDFEKWCNEIYNDRTILTSYQNQELEVLETIIKSKSFYAKGFFKSAFPEYVRIH